MSDVMAYIGDYNSGSGSTPGIYPQISPADVFTFTGNPAMANAVETDFGGPVFSLKHEGGTAGLADASRFIGTLAAGECRTVYWIVT
jgi:hypothetical protein